MILSLSGESTILKNIVDLTVFSQSAVDAR